MPKGIYVRKPRKPRKVYIKALCFGSRERHYKCKKIKGRVYECSLCGKILIRTGKGFMLYQD